MVRYRKNSTIDAIFTRDRGICHICLKPVRKSQATRDHLIPRSEGGTESLSNLALAHYDCNAERMDKRLVLKPYIANQLTETEIEDYKKGFLRPWQIAQRVKVE